MPVEAVFSASVRRITTLARVAESIQVSQGCTEHLGREHRGTFSVAGAASWRGGERHDRLAWGEMTPGSSTNSVVESFTIRQAPGGTVTPLGRDDELATQQAIVRHEPRLLLKIPQVADTGSNPLPVIAREDPQTGVRHEIGPHGEPLTQTSFE